MQVKTSDGAQLAVYDWNPKGKKTVLLVHGWAAFACDL
jgi:non-heme chloroperoxidase